ncbi:hypothetical protein QQF64_025300 [Cirrhinus molitorella]|uniref:Uncharacterized protein n=1 Tax=Cirrhinus molitorella TaxID=172907 RepID=A0ABR3NNN3_9TELE
MRVLRCIMKHSALAASSLPHFRCVGLRNRCWKTFPLVSVLRLARFSVNSAMMSPRPSGCLLKVPRGRPPISVFSPCAGYAPRFWCLAAVQYHSCKCFALPAAVPFGHAVFDVYLELRAVYFGVYDGVCRGGLLMLQRH